MCIRLQSRIIALGEMRNLVSLMVFSSGLLNHELGFGISSFDISSKGLVFPFLVTFCIDLDHRRANFSVLNSLQSKI